MTLAQRMVVMNAGRAEQIGRPMDVYENPATQFVAGFIDSPAMNFMAGVGAGSGRIALAAGGVARGVNGSVEAGRAVTVGIRPEHLNPCAEAEAFISGSVEMIEQLGADSLVHVGHGEATVIARLHHGSSAPLGSTLHLVADPQHVYLFDAADGGRIR
jgi:sn-glycerol 3-phosphate transport system ATP-binding protein